MFQIKQHPSCVFGAKHIHKMIRYSRFLKTSVSSKILKEFDKCLQRNGFFAHPENVLLAMCNDDRPPIRALAYERILRSRKASDDNTNETVRRFTIPCLNFESADYVDMIDWQQASIDQQNPPLLRDLLIHDDNIDRLAMFKITDPQYEGKILDQTGEEKNFDIDLRTLPCHTQAVERCVKLVTEASQMVCGESQREGFLLARTAHRAMMPNFATKKHFVTKKNASAFKI